MGGNVDGEQTRPVRYPPTVGKGSVVDPRSGKEVPASHQ